MTDGRQTFGPDAAAAELRRIVDWWLERTPDYENGGFVGEIDHAGRRVPGADKGIILNSRLLWFFSEVARLYGDDRCRAAARRAYDYLCRHFDDREHGGAVWRLAADGTVLEDRKQIYAQCFCVYAFCAWFDASGDPGAIEQARKYVDLVETYAKDRQHGGYFEAYAGDWSRRVETPLGPAGTDVAKTMNTHLHLLEAYTAVHRSSPDAAGERRLRDAIELMTGRILDRKTGHLRLYFDADWRVHGDIVSFGHDIEASWLLWEAGHALGDDDLLARLRPDVLALARSCLDEGRGPAGNIYNEFDAATGHLAEESVWWVQAEALVGFLNAHCMSGERPYRDACDAVWDFVSRHQLDRVAGDWHWFSTQHTPAANRPYKAGFWKSPYHNGRAMLECMRLFEGIDTA